MNNRTPAGPVTKLGLEHDTIDRLFRRPRVDGLDVLGYITRMACDRGANVRLIPDGGAIIDNRGSRGGSVVCYVAHCDCVPVQWCSGLAWTDNGRIMRGINGCIGADDGAGLLAICSMLYHEHPGMFVLTLDEETGGHGAQVLAPHMRDLHAAGAISCCIEIDRRGTTDVVWDHAMGATGSRAWADDVARLLGMDHKASSHGVFTDVCYWAGEAVGVPGLNIAAGYEGAHGSADSLDLGYLATLVGRLMGIDDKLGALATIDRTVARVSAFSRYDVGRWDDTGRTPDYTGRAHEVSHVSDDGPVRESFERPIRLHGARAIAHDVNDTPCKESYRYSLADVIDMEPARVARMIRRYDPWLARRIKRMILRRWGV